MKKTILLITLSMGAVQFFSAQSSTVSSGGTLSGSGKADYSIGIPLYSPASGTGGIASSGNQQVYEISSTLGTDIQHIQLEMSVYPNPTADIINLKIEQLEKGYEYTFYNATGHLLKKQNIREKTTQIDASTLPKGIYLLSVKKDNQIIKTFKIIKKEN